MEVVKENASKGYNYDFRKPKILLIDDDDVILNLIAELLESESYEVYLANNALDAFKILSANEDIDLILLDYNLKGINGPHLLSQFEEMYPKIIKNTPIVYFTGMFDVHIGKATGMIRKVITIDELLSSIKQFLQLKKQNENVIEKETESLIQH